MTKHPFPDADLARLAGVSVDEWRSAQPAARLEAVRLRGAVPAGCGFDGAIHNAPARGPVEVFSPREVMQTEAGNFRIVRTGYMGATALRRADAFDVMEAQAARQAKARNKDHRPRFTTAQVEAGRTYGHLAERHDARGARCSSIEGQSRGSGGGSYMDAVVAEGQRLDRMRAAIGHAWAMEPQRAAPHTDRRRPINVRAIIDMVCIEGRTLSDVLDRFGWSRKTTHVAEVRAHLCAALDRLHGL